MTVLVTPDGLLWVEVQSMIAYLRRMEASAHEKAEQAVDGGTGASWLAAACAADALRQVGDGLTVTAMEAAEEVRSRRAARR